MKQKIFNRTAAAVDPEAMAAAKKAIQDISGMLPVSEGIPAADRKNMVKINVGNKVFTDDALGAAKSHPEVLPAYLSVAELEKRIEGFEGYDDLIHEAEGLVRRLKDTQARIGAEAYTMALSIYNAFQRACSDGVPGMEAVCHQLGERFKSQGNNGGNGNGQEG